MLFDEPLETERLILRTETEADLDDIYRMNTDPEVMRFVGDGSVMAASREELPELHKQSLAKKDDETFTFAAVILKETDQYIGSCWLRYDDFRDGMELGYRYIKEFWSNGYATEAARAVLKVGFKKVGLEEIFAHAYPENKASIRVIEKLGFEYIEDKYVPSLEITVHVYTLKRKDFLKEKEC